MLFLLAGVGMFAVSTSALAQDCTAGAGADFDGDGLTDLVIGDPDADVSGVARAGSVHIAYGDGGKQTITQRELFDNDNAAGDRFGHALAAADWNNDGCTDLFVGAPFEDWSNNTAVDAGVVVFIPGSAEGLDVAAAASWQQTTFISDIASESGDQLGFSLAAGELTDGTPYLLAGMPGESVGDVEDAGMVLYRTPDGAVTIHQDSTGVSGASEPGDLFGYSVASSPTRFAIGSPGEAIGTELRAGNVQVFTHNGATATPVQFGSANQDSDVISGNAESGDLMGYSLSMVDYRSSSTATATLLAVSAPGEDDSTDADTGWVLEFDAAGTVTERLAFDQNTSGVDGSIEPGDLFGAKISAVNRTPGEVVGWEDVLLAVGSPGEDVGTVRPFSDRGWVQGFSLIGAPGAHGFDPTAELDDVGADWRSDMQLGMWLHTTADHLLVADPHAEDPVVYAVPWNDLLADGEEPVLVYRPSDWGLDAASVGSFGTSMV